METRVKDVMTTQVVAVRRGATFKEMAATLRRYRISALPVVDENRKVIGVVSEADLLAKEALAGHGMIDGLVHYREVRKADGVTAGDLMTHPAVTIRPEDTVEQAARLIYSLRIKRLPVVNAGGGLVGLITRTDLLAVYDRPDTEIRAEVEDVILHEFLEDPRQFAVGVKDGVVTLQGSPETVALGHHVVRKVRQVAGVVAVHDRLSYPKESPVVAAPLF
jgi:CBS domain-containing protein